MSAASSQVDVEIFVDRESLKKLASRAKRRHLDTSTHLSALESRTHKQEEQLNLGKAKTDKEAIEFVWIQSGTLCKLLRASDYIDQLVEESLLKVESVVGSILYDEERDIYRAHGMEPPHESFAKELKALLSLLHSTLRLVVGFEVNEPHVERARADFEQVIPKIEHDMTTLIPDRLPGETEDLAYFRDARTIGLGNENLLNAKRAALGVRCLLEQELKVSTFTGTDERMIRARTVEGMQSISNVAEEMETLVNQAIELGPQPRFKLFHDIQLTLAEIAKANSKLQEASALQDIML